MPEHHNLEDVALECALIETSVGPILNVTINNIC